MNRATMAIVSFLLRVLNARRVVWNHSMVDVKGVESFMRENFLFRTNRIEYLRDILLHVFVISSTSHDYF